MSDSGGMFDYLKKEMKDAEKQSAMAAERLRTRNFIMVSGISFVPMLVLVLIISLLLWDAEALVPSFTYYAALTMPLTGMLGLILALVLHKGESIWLAVAMACLPFLNVVAFFAGIVTWLIL